MSQSMDETHVAKAVELLRDAEFACCLTGAGVSAESGVPTFRDLDGLWQDHRAEELVTIEAFQADPRRVWKFHHGWRELIGSVEPNPGHVALARMEKILPRFELITQNVDGLHQAAGSSGVIELHGNIWDTWCVNCRYQCDAKLQPLSDEPHCPQCGAWLRPGVIWFGEALPIDALRAAQRAALSCDVMLVVGTSAVVQPAASLPEWACQHGASIIEVNPESTPLSRIAAVCLSGPGAHVLPALAEKLSA